MLPGYSPPPTPSQGNAGKTKRMAIQGVILIGAAVVTLTVPFVFARAQGAGLQKEAIPETAEGKLEQISAYGLELLAVCGRNEEQEECANEMESINQYCDKFSVNIRTGEFKEGSDDDFRKCRNGIKQALDKWR